MDEFSPPKSVSVVIIGYDTSNPIEYCSNFSKIKFQKEFGFLPPEISSIPMNPINLQENLIHAFPTILKIKNEKIEISIEFLQKRLQILYKNFVEDKDYGKVFEKIIEELLQYSVTANIKALGFNFIETVNSKNKLCVLNKNIESQLSNELWNKNIKFLTEIAFDKIDYIVTYRILKIDEKFENNEKERLYSIESNFNFKIEEIGQSNKIKQEVKRIKKYHDEYIDIKNKIVGLK